MAEDSIEPLVTECPSCGTRFRVTESQLEIAAGKVRCGSCLEVFFGAENIVLEDGEANLGEDANEALDALLSELAGDSTDVFGVPRESSPTEDEETNEATADPVAGKPDDSDEVLEADSNEDVESIELVAPPEPEDVGEFADLTIDDLEILSSAVEADASPDDASPDTEESDDSGDSPESEPMVEPEPEPDSALEPEIEAVEEPEPEPEPESESEPEPPDVEEIVLDEGPSANLFDSTGKDQSGDPAAADAVTALDALNVDIDPADLGRQSTAKRRWIPAATVVATLALIAQVFWSQRDEWSKDLSIRPIYEFSCDIFGCELAPLRAVDAIYSKNLVVRQHPEVEDALIVDALVINGAHFEQPYPVIELRFSSMSGRTVAGRRFQPDEYLAGEATGAKMIGPNTPVHISLSIKDPGAEAVNYVMLFH